jgi:hypothetical protein
MFRFGTEAARFQRWSTQLRLAGLKRIIPSRKVTRALREKTRARKVVCSKLPDGFMVWFVIALGLFGGDCYRQIYRWLVPRTKKVRVPIRSTLCEARKRLGVRPLVKLVADVVKPLAGPRTPDAFYQGMRLMGLDGFALDLPDTPANARAFGRPVNQRSPGAFPQAQVLGLVELGTHVFWRWLIKGANIDETRMARPLLKHVEPDMLLLWDRGFACFDLVKQVVGRGAQLLARWKNNRILQPRRLLSDGSYLARIYANESDRRADRNGIDVRVIEYTLKEPNRTGCGEKHRLLTTLLNEKRYPAMELVQLYHARWEEELAIDELKTHAKERPVLRSQAPAGIVQEIYGLLLGHYVVRALMFEAAKGAKVGPLRISFTGALKILRCRLGECPRSARGKKRWFRNLLQEIADEQIPPRRNRINPRVIKRQQSAWSKKQPHHRCCPQPVGPFSDSIVILR